MKKSNNFGKMGWIIIIYTMLLFMLSSSGTDTSNVMLPALAELKGWPYPVLMAAALPASILSGFVVAGVGTAITRKGVKIVTIINLAAVVVCQVIQAFAPTMPVFLMAVTLVTLGTVSLNLCCAQTLISNWFPRKKGVALGWATAGMCLSGVALVPASNALVQGNNGQVWPAYLMVAIIALVLMILTFFLKSYPEEAGCLSDNEPMTEEERLALGNKDAMRGDLTVKQIAGNRQTWILMVGFGILFMGLMGVVIMTIPRLTAVGVGQDAATGLFAVSTVIGFIVSIIWGYIDQKIGTKKTSVIFSILWLVMLACCAAGAMLKSIPVSVASVFLFGSLFGGLGNLFPSAVIWVYGRKEFANVNRFISAGMALIRALGIIIMSVSLTIAGEGNDAVGYGNGYLLLTVLTIVGLVLIAGLKQNVPASNSASTN